MIGRAPEAAAARAAAAVALALIAVGCVRSRHPELSGASPTQAPPVPSTETAPLDEGIGSVVDEPADGARVTSPIRVAGRLGETTGRVAVAQILSVDGDGQETRRGNALLAPSGADGAYAADVAYTLDAAGPGIVEVVLVEPETGTVMERARVPVVLEAAP